MNKAENSKLAAELNDLKAHLRDTTAFTTLIAKDQEQRECLSTVFYEVSNILPQVTTSAASFVYGATRVLHPTYTSSAGVMHTLQKIRNNEALYTFIKTCIFVVYPRSIGWEFAHEVSQVYTKTNAS
jgi:hypothetical protein